MALHAFCSWCVLRAIQGTVQGLHEALSWHLSLSHQVYSAFSRRLHCYCTSHTARCLKMLTESYLAIASGDFCYNFPRRISSVLVGGTVCDMGLGFCSNAGLHHDLCSRSSWTVVFSRQEWSIYSASGTIEPVITSLHSNIHSLCAFHAQVREAWRGFCCSPIAPPHNNSTVQMLVQFFKITCLLADRGATN